MTRDYHKDRKQIWPEEYTDGAKIPPESKDQKDVEGTWIIPEIGQISPQLPFRWIDRDENPYPTPEAEYVTSNVSLAMLKHRWRGLWTEHEIDIARIRDNWELKRFKYFDDLNEKSYQESLLGNVEYQKRAINQDIMRCEAMMRQIEDDLNSGMEYLPIRGAPGMAYGRIMMTGKTKASLMNSFAKLSDLRATRIELVTKITEMRGDPNFSITAELLNAQAMYTDSYRKVLERAGIKGVLTESLIEADSKVIDIHPKDLVPVESDQDDDSDF